MANSDALKFSVQIVEDDKKNVESLIRKVQLMLDKDFRLKVSDEGAVKNLEAMLNVLKSVEAQMGVISKGLSNSPWGKLGDDLNIAIAEFRKLTSSAEEFGRTMSKGFASNLRSELDSLLPKLAETAKLVDKVKNESRKGDGSGGIVEGAASIAKASAYYERLYSLAAKIYKAEDRMGGKGINTESLARYRQQLSEIYNELDKIRRSQDGLHPTSGLTAAEYIKSVGALDVYSVADKGLKSLTEAEKVMDGMAALSDKIANRLNDIGEANPLRARLETAKQDLDLMQGLVARNPNDIAKDAEARNQKMQEYERLLDSALQKEREMQKTTSSATKELDAIERKMKEVAELTSRMRSLGLDTTSIEKASTELEKLRHSYQLMAAGNGNFAAFKADAETIASERGIAEAISGATQRIKEKEIALKQADMAKNRAAKESQKLSAEEQKLANAMKQTTQQGMLQANVLNDLKSMAAQYLSIWGASSFIQSMTQITGELELQQKSLEVIIGSASYASQLFGEIRDLSQQSPYTFQDLLKSTRQLAAFGIETKDLYGTMKSLSDIGAGLSVDVQRLILAYGHTKSYGYLSGIQNRQFETAGIDLVGALADRYNKLADAEERAGRAAEHVTRKDVFKKISKKEVSFEDVNAVIMDLDSPGGKFYNMQERQFETLGGKLRNLRNNYNIMMAEMGKANHGMLMSGVNMLNELTEHWDKYARIITSIVVPIGALKLATLAVNGALGNQGKVMASNLLNMARISTMNQAYKDAMVNGSFSSAFMSGWSAQNSKYVSNKHFRKSITGAVDEGQISRAQAASIGLNNKLALSYRVAALEAAGFDMAQRRMLITANPLQRSLIMLRLRVVDFGKALSGAFAATLANPMTWIMGIFAGVTAIYSHFSSMASETKDALDQLASNAKEDAKSIDEVIGRYSERGVSQSGASGYLNGNRIQGVGLSFDMEKIKSMTSADLEDLKQELQKISPFYEGDLVDIGKFETQAEQIMAIMRKLDSYHHAEQVLAATADEHSAAANGRFSWWLGIGSHESFITNLEDMSKAFGNMREQVDKFSEEQIDEFDKAMGGELTRMKESGAAVSLAEALKVKLVNSLSMSEKDRKKMVKSWNNGDLEDLFKHTQWIGRSHYTKTGVAAAYKEDFEWNVKRLSASLQGEINKNFTQDDIDGALKYALEAYNTFASQAKGVSEEVKQYGLNMVLQSVFGDGSKFGIGYKELLNKQFAGEVSASVGRAGNVNLYMDPREVQANVMEVVEKTKEQWRAAGRDVNQITTDTIKSIVATILNANKIEEAWKKRLAFMKKGDSQAMSDFGNLYSKEIKDATDYYEFWFDTMKKKYDEYTKDLADIFKPLRKKWNIEIAADFEFKMENLDKLKAVRDAILDKKKNSPFWNKEEQEELDTALNRLNPLITMMEVMKQEGIDFDKSKKNGRSGSGGSKEDKDAKRLREQAKLFKDAYDWYNKYEKQLGSEAGALARVQAQFQPLFDEFNKTWKRNLTLDSIPEYRKNLKELLDEGLRLYQSPKHKNSYMVEAVKQLRDAINSVDFEELEKAQNKFASAMSKNLDDLSRKWKIYQELLSKTGNSAMAARVSGVSKGTLYQSDAVRALLDRQIAGYGNVGSIDYNRVFGMSDEEVEKYAGSLFPTIKREDYGDDAESYQKALDANQDKIKAVTEALKKWRDLQGEAYEDGIGIYSELLAGLIDTESQISRINQKYDEQIEKIKDLRALGAEKGGLSQTEADRATEIANARRQSELLKQEPGYRNFMTAITVMGMNEIQAMGKAIKDDLTNSLKAGTITAQEYADKIKEVDDKMRNSKFSAIDYVGNDAQSILGKISQQGRDKVQAGGELMQRGQSLISNNPEFSDEWLEGQGMMEQGSDMAAMGADMMQGAAGASAAIAIIDKIVHGMDGLVQGMKGIFDDIMSMKEALGKDTHSATAQNADTFLSTFSAASAQATAGWDSLKNGDIGGAIKGTIGSWTAWWKGIAEGRDKKLQYKIDELNKEVSHIGNTLELIRGLRERTLGYDYGDAMRNMASYYQNAEKRAFLSYTKGGFHSKVKQSTVEDGMSEYYSRGENARGKQDLSGYQQEYNALKKQRELQMQMYDLEKDKKNKDEEKLEEYKKQIAELDEQIINFVGDLMNELWGIDFKGWASQISDALMTAFENGTSAAKALKDTMNDIMKSIVKSMMQMAIIEPFLNQLQKQIMGYTDEGGQYHAGVIDASNPDEFLSDPEKKTADVVGAIGKWYEKVGPALSVAVPGYLEGINDELRQYGLDLRANSEGQSGSNSIQQSITEESAGYMTGLLAAMHQDGSVRRLLQQTLVAEQMPNVIEMMTVSGGHIAGIDENTRAIMHMMQDGSGRMYERIDYIGTKLDRFASGFDRITIN